MKSRPLSETDFATAGSELEIPTPEDQRYERKFTPETCSARQVAALLKMHPAMFRTAFADRYVNNIYLDTMDASCYRDHIDGSARRAKFRIRWYGDLNQASAKPTFEIKQRAGLVGSKLRFKLPDLDTRSDIDEKRIRGLLSEARIHVGIASRVASMRCALGNRYRRSYLLSADGAFRMTIDHELEFFSPAIGSRAGVVIRDPSLIIEMKYRREHDSDAEAITARLPFRVSRFSKYCAGVQQLSAQGLG